MFPRRIRAVIAVGGCFLLMRSKESARLSATRKDENGRNCVSLSVEISADRVTELTAEEDDLLIRLNEYKVLSENIERNLLKKRLC